MCFEKSGIFNIHIFIVADEVLSSRTKHFSLFNKNSCTESTGNYLPLFICSWLVLF